MVYQPARIHPCQRNCSWHHAERPKEIEMTNFTYDQAVERFNEDMSNSICDGDRKMATQWLAERINDTDRAERLRRDWMIQYRQSMRELA
jgi:hypothetical protein